MKRFMVYILIAVLLFASGAALAETGIKLTINGQQVSFKTQPKFEDDVLMVPLGELADAIHAKATVDPVSRKADLVISDDTRIANLVSENQALRAEIQTLNDKLKALGQDDTPPAAGDVGRSRRSPVPVGTPIQASLERSTAQGKVPFTAVVKVTEVVRGDAAWKRIQEANMFNDPPKPGQEYVLAKVLIKLAAIDDEETAVDVSKYWFTAVSSSGRDYPRVSTVDPEPEVEARLYKGASNEGWVSFVVDKSDVSPVMTFARDYQGRGGYWFELKPAHAGTSTTVAGSTAPSASGSIKTGADLATYLQENHGSLTTPAGTIQLKYTIHDNDSNLFPWDMWVRMDWDPFLFFTNLRTSLKISEKDRQETAAILRAHSKKVYDIAAAAFPGKKIQGSYYTSWYRYPNLRVDLISRTYFSWANYRWDILGPGKSTYDNSHLGGFRWTPDQDDAQF